MQNQQPRTEDAQTELTTTITNLTEQTLKTRTEQIFNKTLEETINNQFNRLKTTRTNK